MQRNEATNVATELRGAASFDADFGRLGVDPHVLADRLEATAGWDAFFLAVDSWAPIARSIRAAAWDAILRDLKPLGTFLSTVGESSEVGQRYKALAKFFGLRKEVARRGATTRRQNKGKGSKKKPPAPAEPPKT